MRARGGWWRGTLGAALLLALVVGMPAWAGESEAAGRRRVTSATGLKGTWPTWTRIRLDVAPGAMNRLGTEPRAWVPVTARFGDGPGMAGRMRIKGTRGSLQRLDQNPSFTLDLERPVEALGGATRLHLENGAEDPWCVRGAWAAHVFNEAGVPCPRQGWACVRLNDRDLGWRGLKEGIDGAFVARAWPGEDVVVMEPRDGADVGDELELKEAGLRDVAKEGEARERGRAAWRSLADAVQRGGWDAARPWVDAGAFVRFAALEVLMGHRDGYALARNNYRVALVRGRLEWVPWGLDTLMETPSLTTWPSMAGSLARALMATEEGRTSWMAALRGWHERALGAGGFEAWARECEAALRPVLGAGDYGAWHSAKEALHGALRARAAWVAEELARGVPTNALAAVGTAMRPVGWRAQGVPGDGAAREVEVEGLGVLELVAGERNSSAWACAVPLGPGLYRFLGRARVEGFRSLPGARRDGAVLRVGNTASRSRSLQAGAGWTELRVDFRVEEPGTVVALMCEYRASAGRAGFDRASLLLERLE